jgi:hypothetical protein
LEAEHTGDDCGLARAQLADLVLPTQTADGRPAPALKFGQPRAMALLCALCCFSCAPEGVTNGRVRPAVAQLLGVPDDTHTTRTWATIYGAPLARACSTASRADSVTPVTLGQRPALSLTKVHARVLRPSLQALDLRLVAQAPPRLLILFTELDGVPSRARSDLKRDEDRPSP